MQISRSTECLGETVESKGRLILVVRDQVIACEIIDLLSAEAFACDVAVDSETAEARVIQHTYDLVIVDQDLPGNTDLRLLQDLRKFNPDLPLLLTAREPSIENCMAVSAMSFAEYQDLRILGSGFTENVAGLAAQGQIAAQVRETRSRLEEWSQNLAMVEQLLVHGARSGSVESARSMVLMTMSNIVSGLVDIERIGDIQRHMPVSVPGPDEVLDSCTPADFPDDPGHGTGFSQES